METVDEGPPQYASWSPVRHTHTHMHARTHTHTHTGTHTHTQARAHHVDTTWTASCPWETRTLSFELGV